MIFAWKKEHIFSRLFSIEINRTLLYNKNTFNDHANIMSNHYMTVRKDMKILQITVGSFDPAVT